MDTQLNEYGLAELNNAELRMFSGGIWAALAVGLLGAAIYDLAANHEAFVAGFRAGYNA